MFPLWIAHCLQIPVAQIGGDPDYLRTRIPVVDEAVYSGRLP